jgi:dTDP-4-dehydrorhamnose reductase
VKAVILGAGGQLATDLEEAMSDWSVTGLPHSELDVCDFDRVTRVLGDLQPEVVINTAAFHHVDNCEDQWQQAFDVNAFACRNLAQVCADLGATLVHVSTDYVFSGDRSSPYRESDLPDPLSVYGMSKVAGEFFIRTLCPSHIIVRSAGLYGVAGASGKGGNFVETMIRLAKGGKPLRVVDDQIISPTYTKDLAQKIKEVIQSGGRGIFHLTNAGGCSWHAFAGQIFHDLRLNPDFGPTTTAAYGAKAARPPYSVLESDKLERLGVEPLAPWQDALHRYLVEKGHV